MKRGVWAWKSPLFRQETLAGSRTLEHNTPTISPPNEPFAARLQRRLELLGLGLKDPALRSLVGNPGF